MTEFFQEHWPIAVLFFGYAIKILNLSTKHFSEHKGFVKIALFIVDVLDVLKVTPAPRQKQKGGGSMMLALALCLSVGGCAHMAKAGDVIKKVCEHVPAAYSAAIAVCAALPAEKQRVCMRKVEKGYTYINAGVAAGAAVVGSCATPD